MPGGCARRAPRPGARPRAGSPPAPRRATRGPLRLPGRLRISVSPTLPATARDSAAIGVCASPVARISSASPGASRSITARSPPASRREGRTRAAGRHDQVVVGAARGAPPRCRLARPARRAERTSKPASRSSTSAASLTRPRACATVRDRHHGRSSVPCEEPSAGQRVPVPRSEEVSVLGWAGGPARTPDEEDLMEWVDRLAAELHLEALRPRARSPAVGVPRGGAPGGAEGHAARDVRRGTVGRDTARRPQARRRDRGRDHALLLRLPEPEDD